MFINEEWRPIPGFESTYQASSQGRIARVSTYGRKLKQATPNCKSGYLYVQLWQGNVMHMRTIHSLVAEAFLGPCPEGMEVSHQDGHRWNCEVGNLRYETPAENHARKREHGTALVGERNHAAKLTEEDVRLIRADLADGRSTASLAREHGVTARSIRNIATRATWRHVA